MMSYLKIKSLPSSSVLIAMRTVFLAALFVVIMIDSPRAQLFGDGSDGPIVVTGTMDLTADLNATDLFINTGAVLETHGFTVYVFSLLLNNGTITDSYSGGDGGPGGSAGTGGQGWNPHIDPVPGGPGQSGSAPSVSGAGTGGRGGGGGGGGGGAWDITNSRTGSGGGGGNGGIGGKGGGLVQINANFFINNTLIHTDALPGANGNNGLGGGFVFYLDLFLLQPRDLAGGGGGGSAGGSGGNGGTVNITYGKLLWTGTIRSIGGAPGTTSGGGASQITSFLAASGSFAQNGALGGSPGGGSGGWSQAGAFGSQAGAPGLSGSNGSNGSVNMIQASLCYVDTDGDGFGSVSDPGSWTAGGCGAGFSTNNLDCNDAVASIYPGAPEVPDDGIDQDCNGSDAVTCIVDADMDGFGTDAGTTVIAGDGSCDVAQQESNNDTDCNDAVASIYPGAPEVPDDGIDQDCNGSDAVTCIVDADMDGFGTDAGTVVIAGDGSCDAAQQESNNDTDCNDAVASIYPGAPEVPDDGIDQDCNGSDAVTCIVDADQDGFGTDAGTTVIAGDGSCDAAQQESNNDTDCDDSDPAINPNATEILDDGIDQDCDGSDATCCGLFTSGQTGNTNCDTDGKRNLADITRLIDNVYISKVALCCPRNGNTNGDVLDKINLADITRLIDNVYISKDETEPCN